MNVLSGGVGCPLMPIVRHFRIIYALMYVSLKKAAQTVQQYCTNNTNAYIQHANIINLAAIVK